MAHLHHNYIRLLSDGHQMSVFFVYERVLSYKQNTRESLRIHSIRCTVHTVTALIIEPSSFFFCGGKIRKSWRFLLPFPPTILAPSGSILSNATVHQKRKTTDPLMDLDEVLRHAMLTLPSHMHANPSNVRCKATNTQQSQTTDSVPNPNSARLIYI
jgi:hypothetical protein